MNVAEQILAGEQLARSVPRESLVAPASVLAIGGVQAMSATGTRGARCVVPRSGTLVDLHVYVGTASGTARGAVYDTAATTRSRLWTSAAAVTVAASGWVKLGDPNLAVVAGQAIDLAVSADNPTLTIGRMNAPPPAAVVTLPAAFAAAGGGLAILAWLAAGSPPPAALAESALTATTVAPALIARIA